MPKFVLAYHGKPDINSPEEGADHMEAWRSWMTGLGEAVADPGLAVGMSVTLSAKGTENNGGANPISGYTVLQAETMDEVVALTKTCPHLSGSGTIEIAEALDLDM